MGVRFVFRVAMLALIGFFPGAVNSVYSTKRRYAQERLLSKTARESAGARIRDKMETAGRHVVLTAELLPPKLSRRLRIPRSLPGCDGRGVAPG